MTRDVRPALDQVRRRASARIWVTVQLVAFALLLCVVRTASSQTQRTERDVLLELFRDTGGPSWSRNARWLSDEPVCRWEGVVCGFYESSGPVTRLELPENNLGGSLPSSLALLKDLKVLDLSRNKLTGPVPAELLRRANANVLALHTWGNSLSDHLTQVRIQRSSYTGTCVPDQELEFYAEVDGPARTAVYASVHCGDPVRGDEGAYCLKAERRAPDLDQLSRGLQRLDFASAKPEYSSPHGLSTHVEVLRTAVQWGDGRSQAVLRTGGLAPLEVWLAQEVILGVVPTDWHRQARRVDCDALPRPRP